MTPTPIILDCDPGHDDAIALLLALASPELELVGVTTVCGNQTIEKTTANALRVLEFAGRGDVPVAPRSRTGRSSESARWPRTSTARAASTGPTCLPRAAPRSPSMQSTSWPARSARAPAA